MSDTPAIPDKIKRQKIQYTVRINDNEVIPLAVYCRRHKLSMKVVYSRIMRRNLTTKAVIKKGYIEFSPFSPPGDEVLSKKHLPKGGTGEWF